MTFMQKYNTFDKDPFLLIFYNAQVFQEVVLYGGEKDNEDYKNEISAR